MAKTIQKKIKVQVPAGKATPAPPLGPVLGQAGINIGEFVNQFNDLTRDRMGDIVPVVITVYDDRSFDFITKTSPAARLILKALNIKKGAHKNLVENVGTLTKDQVKGIAEEKMVDLNANDIEAAMKIIEGTAKSMGVNVK
ncbi:50S ribosomal protein L11 [Candidatus Wolfebacteria bacterium]|nr:MAG: 50S ribosomal protein L11 [Candidatus Wolfebacteria bacterium]